MSLHRGLGVDGPSFYDLSAPVRARSILLSTHQLQIEEITTTALASAQAGPPPLSSAAIDYGFVAVDAVPYLVSWGEELRPGPLLAVAAGVQEALGTLHLAGELGEWIYPAAELRVADALAEHRECMVEPARDLVEVLRLRVAPLRVHRIWTGPPGITDPPAIDRTSFESAEPDAWAAFGHAVVRHLNQHHQEHLLDLARASGAPGSTAVSLTRLDSGGAILTAMSREGVMDVVMPFDPPAATPGEASYRLTGTH
jgi:hypothetical protein